MYRLPSYSYEAPILKVETLVEPDEATLRNQSYKLRRYLGVRTLTSFTTGVLIGLFAWTVDLQFPVEWAVITFTLNYITYHSSARSSLRSSQPYSKWRR